MTLTVLVPLDGSPLAERALPYAVNLVANGDGRIVLTHVRTPRQKGTADFDVAHTVESLREDGVNATSLVYHAPTAAVADVIHEAVRESSADLVVMSTHGRGGLRRTIFGSVADQVMRQADVPVLLIPPDSAPNWEAEQRAQILVPLDGSLLAEEVLAPVARLAVQLHAEILLVSALSRTLHARFREGKLRLSSADFQEVEDTWHYLDGIADGLRSDGHYVSIWVLVGSPSAAITGDAANEGEAARPPTELPEGGLAVG